MIWVQKRVIQIDFDFHLIESDFTLNLDEIEWAKKEMCKLFSYDFYHSFNIQLEYKKDYEKFYDISHARFQEICAIGYSRSIMKELDFSFFDFNMKKYTSNYKKFLKQNKGFEFFITDLYESNIRNLCNYFMCSKSKLFKMDLLNGYSDRLVLDAKTGFKKLKNQ